MAIDFPASPANGATHTAAGAVWQYDGVKWKANSASAPGDITSVTAGTGLSGGGTSGDVSLALATPVAISSGGTNLTAYAQGDLIYASAANVLSALAKDATATRYLSNTGATNNPAWAQVALANGVTGVLPIANGGTGSSTAAAAPWVEVAGDTMLADLSIAPAAASAQLQLHKPTAAYGCSILGYTGSNCRWAINMPSSAAESGSNAGSNFEIARFSDAGAFIDNPLTINRANGLLTISSFLTSMKSCDHFPTGAYAPASNAVVRIGTTAGYYGIVIRPNFTGVGGMIAFENQGSGVIGSITNNDTNVAYNTSSDARLKEDPRSFDAGPIIDSTSVYDFAWKLTGKRAYGVFAQEAAEVYPQAITHDEMGDTWGADYSMYVPILLQELKALRRRVAALEGA